MFSITVDSCPVCYQPHVFKQVAGVITGDVELRCPTFGETFPAQLSAVAKPLPVHLFGRQARLPVS